MKKLFKTLFLLVASSSLVFVGCKKDDNKTTTEPTVLAPTLKINDGATTNTVSSLVDTIRLKIVASADVNHKITKLKITRVVTGPTPSNNIIKDSTLSIKDLSFTYKDIIVGNLGIEDGDILTYSIVVTDDKGNQTSGSFVVTITSFSASPQIYLGGPSNTANDYHFLGTAESFRAYRAGSTGPDLAKDNSAKVDFVYYYNSAGSVQNALYSPDYLYAAGTGWATEVGTWPTKNKTLYKIADLTSPQFDALNATQFITELDLIDFGAGTQDKVANLTINNIIAYKKADGKRGFIKIGNTATQASGAMLIIVKSEL